MKANETASAAKGKKGKDNLPAVINAKSFENSLNANFDDLFFKDEKLTEKEVEFHTARKKKKVQLVAEISRIESELAEAEKALLKSLIDPLQDSIKAKIKVTVLTEQKKIGHELLYQLFPNEGNGGMVETSKQ